MSDGNPVGSFFAELLNVVGVILLGLCKVIKVAFLVFGWIIILGCVITKNR